MTENGTREYATLDSLRALIHQERDVEIDGVGTVRLRKISIREFLQMQEDAKREDGTVDEWEATKLLIASGVAQPPIGDDEELLGSLPIGLVRSLTTEIAAFAGTDESFSGGSLTE